MYGFHKVDDPTGADTKHFEFRNPNFVPGRKELLKRIERRKAVKRTTRKDDDPAGKHVATGHSRRASASASASLPPPPQLVASDTSAPATGISFSITSLLYSFFLGCVCI